MSAKWVGAERPRAIALGLFWCSQFYDKCVIVTLRLAMLLKKHVANMWQILNADLRKIPKFRCIWTFLSFAWRAEGQRFETVSVHQNKHPEIFAVSGCFCVFWEFKARFCLKIRYFRTSALSVFIRCIWRYFEKDVANMWLCQYNFDEDHSCINACLNLLRIYCMIYL